MSIHPCRELVPSRPRRSWSRTALAAGVFAAAVLAACSSDDGSGTSAVTAQPADTSASQPPPDANSVGTPTPDYPVERFVGSDGVGVVPDLPRRVGYANLGDAEIFTAWGEALRSAVEARDLEYITASADFDPAANVDQIRSFVDRGVAAMLVTVLDAPAQRPVVLEAMEAGIAVFTVAFGPSTVQMLTDQYASGHAAAEAMVDHINAHLAGHAEILMFNLDDREGIRPRYQAVRDVVAAAGDDINIAVDQLGSPQTAEHGFEVMTTVLQSHPDVNVVIGEDAHVLGALAALRAAGVDDDPRWLLVGIGGEQQALDEVADETSPLKIDVSFALPTIGVIPGMFADEWLAGRTIPSVVTFNPIVLDSADKVHEFQTDMADPEALFDSPKQDTYLNMLGHISYQTRMSYYDGDGSPADAAAAATGG